MNRLEHYRVKAGLTQSELAEKAYVDQGNISKAERGMRDFLGRTWCSIADVLGCSVDELLGREKEEN